MGSKADRKAEKVEKHLVRLREEDKRRQQRKAEQSHVILPGPMQIFHTRGR